MDKRAYRTRAYRAAWVIGFLALGTPCSDACSVPVHRYALERWPPDPHIVTIGDAVSGYTEALSTGHDVNIWIERAGTGQTSEVSVQYADGSGTWFNGAMRPGLLSSLVDSPMRRGIAHELLTGTAAVFVLIESSDSKTNDALFASISQRLSAAAAEMDVPDNVDYEDEEDGWTGGGSGQGASGIPLKASFSLHRVSRDNPAEAFFVRQVTGLDPRYASNTEPLVAVIFGRGRMMVLAGSELIPRTIDEVCWFLCSACSCRVKAMNPGVDVLMAANWDEAIYAFPDQVITRLPFGEAFVLGGTGTVAWAERAMSPGGRSDAPPKTDPGNASRKNLPVIVVFMACALVIVLALRRRRK